MTEAALPDFETLDRLKTFLDTIRRSHASTMFHYVSDDRKGFFHQPQNRDAASRSSTATCVSSLVHAGLWDSSENEWLPDTGVVASKLLEQPWKSARLPKNNPFSVAFIIEGILDLQKASPSYPGAPENLRLVTDEMVPILIAQIKKVGAVRIPPYPESTYLTQLAYRVLRRLGKVEKPLEKRIHAWARQQIHRHIALISSRSRVADPLALAYALILVSTTASGEEIPPEDKHLFAHALDLFFKSQGDDGKWPPSQPLFHYPKLGNAYCFEYEVLTQLLQCQELRIALLPYIPNMARAAFSLDATSFDLEPPNPGKVLAWASGHHPQIEGPESWSTASVYHFAHALDRLVAEAIRRVVFVEIGRVYRAPGNAKSDPASFATKLLDADLNINGERFSLRETLANQFVLPISKSAEKVQSGKGLNQPMSAILYGPPGTSKTQLAKHIGEYLSWPLLSIDPSYVVSRGLDQLQSQANRLFRMLELTEQVVVLLDEFDEMGRDRSKSENLLSRFITTSMLPKLVSINEAKKIVFLLATNYIGGFDSAFSRGGRFDMVLQVMQPNYQAKIDHWPALQDKVSKLSEQAKLKAIKEISDLTYLECEVLGKKLNNLENAPEIASEIATAWKGCTLERAVNDALSEDIDPSEESLRKSATPAKKTKTWQQVCVEEQRHIRLPI